MSITPTEGNAAANRSGRWLTTAPTSSPPLDPPPMASFFGDVYPVRIRCSAAPMKSSKTFCLCSFVPARCHASPNSPPPRRFGTASTPPASSHTTSAIENLGVIGMRNPPYPVRYVGFEPSSLIPLRCVTNIGTLVPSLLVYHTCSVSYGDGSKFTSGLRKTVLVPLFTSYR